MNIHYSMNDYSVENHFYIMEQTPDTSYSDVQLDDFNKSGGYAFVVIE